MTSKKVGFFNNVNVRLQLRLNNNIFNIVNTENNQQQPHLQLIFPIILEKSLGTEETTWDYFCLPISLLLLSFVNIALISA